MSESVLDRKNTSDATESISTPDLTRISSHEAVMAILFAMPPLFVIALLAWGAATEFGDRIKVNRIITTEMKDWGSLRTVGLTQEADKQASRKHAAMWDSINRSMGRFQDNEDNVVEAYTTLTPPDQPWAAEPYAKRKARETEWIDYQINKIEDDPTLQSTTTDGRLNGLSHYQPAHQMRQRDSNAFRVAFYEGKYDETIKVLRRINPTIDESNLPRSVPSNNAWIDRLREFMQLIRDGVQFSFWSDEVLNQLRLTLATDWRLEQRFRDSVKSSFTSQLIDLQQIGKDDRQDWRSRNRQLVAPFGVSHTQIANVIASQKRILQISQAGTWKHALETRRTLGRQSGGNSPDTAISLIAIPLARSSDLLTNSQLFFLSRGFARIETERRWTVTAIAIRQYRNQFEQWPEQLTQLSRVGLTTDQWCFEPGEFLVTWSAKMAPKPVCGHRISESTYRAPL